MSSPSSEQTIGQPALTIEDKRQASTALLEFFVDLNASNRTSKKSVNHLPDNVSTAVLAVSSDRRALLVKLLELNVPGGYINLELPRAVSTGDFWLVKLLLENVCGCIRARPKEAKLRQKCKVVNELVQDCEIIDGDAQDWRHANARSNLPKRELRYDVDNVTKVQELQDRIREGENVANYIVIDDDGWRSADKSDLEEPASKTRDSVAEEISLLASNLMEDFASNLSHLYDLKVRYRMMKLLLELGARGQCMTIASSRMTGRDVLIDRDLLDLFISNIPKNRRSDYISNIVQGLRWCPVNVLDQVLSTTELDKTTLLTLLETSKQVRLYDPEAQKFLCMWKHCRPRRDLNDLAARVFGMYVETYAHNYGYSHSPDWPLELMTQILSGALMGIATPWSNVSSGPILMASFKKIISVGATNVIKMVLEKVGSMLPASLIDELILTTVRSAPSRTRVEILELLLKFEVSQDCLRNALESAESARYNAEGICVALFEADPNEPPKEDLQISMILDKRFAMVVAALVKHLEHCPEDLSQLRCYCLENQPAWQGTIPESLLETALYKAFELADERLCSLILSKYPSKFHIRPLLLETACRAPPTVMSLIIERVPSAHSHRILDDCLGYASFDTAHPSNCEQLLSLAGSSYKISTEVLCRATDRAMMMSAGYSQQPLIAMLQTRPSQAALAAAFQRAFTLFLTHEVSILSRPEARRKLKTLSLIVAAGFRELNTLENSLFVLCSAKRDHTAWDPPTEAVDLTQSLLNQGVEADHMNGRCVFAAAKNGQFEILDMLLKKTREKPTIAAPRWFANYGDCKWFYENLSNNLDEKNDRLKTVRTLLENGVQCPAIDEALLVAVGSHHLDNDYEMAELILSYDPNVDYKGGLALQHIYQMLAPLSRRSFTRLIILAARRAKSEVKDPDGMSFLYYAVKSIRFEVEVTMRDLKGLFNGSTRDDGSLHMAAYGQHERIVNVLLLDGHDPNKIVHSKDMQGFSGTALMYLCRGVNLGFELDSGSKYERIVRRLLQSGAQAKTELQKSAFFCALENPHCSEWLLRHLLHCFPVSQTSRSFFEFVDGSLCYSASIYLEKYRSSLPERTPAWISRISSFLESKGLLRRLYATEGPQPEGAVNVPTEILAKEERRMLRVLLQSKPCGVCSERITDPKKVYGSLTESCTHDWTFIVCAECLGETMEQRMTEDQGAVSSSIQCWAPDCRELLSHAEVQKYSDREVFETYDEALFRRTLHASPLFTECSRERCKGGGWLASEAVTNFRCTVCNQETCVEHNGPYDDHRGRPCPATADKRAQAEAEAKARQRHEGLHKTKKTLKRTSKPCPSCSAPIERNGGCDHMTCRCKEEFCWVCGALYKDIHVKGRSAHLTSCPNWKRGL